jgi:hypothetical protein
MKTTQTPTPKRPLILSEQLREDYMRRQQREGRDFTFKPLSVAPRGRRRKEATAR